MIFTLILNKKIRKKINLKTDLCNQINDIAKNSFKSHHDCEIANKEVENIVTKWKAIGRVSKNDNKECWKQLRESLNNFYKKEIIFIKKERRKTKILSRLKHKFVKMLKNLKKILIGKKLLKKL